MAKLARVPPAAAARGQPRVFLDGTGSYGQATSASISSTRASAALIRPFTKGRRRCSGRDRWGRGRVEDETRCCAPGAAAREVLASNSIARRSAERDRVIRRVVVWPQPAGPSSVRSSPSATSRSRCEQPRPRRFVESWVRGTSTSGQVRIDQVSPLEVARPKTEEHRCAETR